MYTFGRRTRGQSQRQERVSQRVWMGDEGWSRGTVSRCGEGGERRRRRGSGDEWFTL